MRFLFAGCGSIGRRHIQNLKSLLPACEILAYRARRQPLGAFGKKYRIREMGNLQTALAVRPDAAFVTNPSSQHLSVARAAARKGIPLFMEKPLSHSMAGIDGFIRLCEKKKLPVMIGYKMRFHPSILRIKRLLDTRALGKVLAAKVQYGGYLPDWHPWEDYRRMYSSQRRLGGGIILDAIHELDYLIWLLGPVRRVKALGGRLSKLDIDTEDTAEILLEFQSGAVGNVHVNYVQRPEIRSCQIIGEKGSIFWDTLRKSVDWYDGRTKRWRRFPENRRFQANDMFVAEMRYFLRCLKNGKRPLPDLRSQRDVLAWALAAQRQCRMKV